MSKVKNLSVQLSNSMTLINVIERVLGRVFVVIWPITRARQPSLDRLLSTEYESGEPMKNDVC